MVYLYLGGTQAEKWSLKFSVNKCTLLVKSDSFLDDKIYNFIIVLFVDLQEVITVGNFGN